MTQAERRLYLITELLKEDKGSAGFKLGLVPGNEGGFVIPDDEKSQCDILRALMNIRGPYSISEDFLRIQDEYLQQVNKERGITNIADLKPVRETGGFDKLNHRGQLYLWQGDITTLKVDAIVNAANSALLGCFAPLHICIDNCIHTFAGIQLRLACYELMQKQGHEEGTGLCKITPAFNLPSRYVLHTVGPIIYTSVGPREKILLANCYKNCLETAAQNQLESVAFCCISTGVFRFPADLAAQIAVETIEMWLAENPDSSVKKVVFNVFGNKDLEIYQGLLL
ncbi:O-acetyl-ADP-ribose deacetylase (regulator of RNase III), contains Macro domain [Treponema bryantii]|uniref:Protein-ADP-ribose hydrolase n=1 Tax=Treponema bryantii TaxID=163 RepID=A0A1H9D5A9_9SPIR|nr:protein-ADP-ribose hydrolase [Treponema bryantii]SEQ08672.1 O-acetyl-ADP-ribose deacetylase (regulator of RNase III), contains Macro domain [Treponema bryantii]